MRDSKSFSRSDTGAVIRNLLSAFGKASIVAWAIIAIAILLAPFMALALWSLFGREEIGMYNLAPSFDWLIGEVASHDFRSALFFSLLIAGVVTPICGVVIAVFDYSGAVYGWICEAILAVTSALIVLLPIVLYALAVRVWLVPIAGSTFATIVAQIAYFSATGYILFSTFRSRSARLLISAAQTMGASHVSTFRHVSLPMQRSALIATCAVLFCLSIDESVFSIFVLNDYNRTIPRYLWDNIDYQNDPSIAAASICVLIVLAPVFAFGARYLMSAFSRSRQ